MDAQPGGRDPRFVILDGIRTEQRRQTATERLHGADPDDAGVPDRAALVRQVEALEVMAAICAAQTRAARALDDTSAIHRWHRLTALVEIEVAALQRQLEPPSG